MKIACLVYELYTYLSQRGGHHGALWNYFITSKRWVDLNEYGNYFNRGLFAQKFALCVLINFT